MARGPRYKVPRRRRREGKTNYYKRYRYVLSGHIRAVVRKTNKYIIVQFIKFNPIGDETLVACHSNELSKLFGWKGDPNNTPAAYLTGLVAGLRALKAGIKYAVPDIGLHRPVRGSRIFAAIKGIRDAGVEVPASKEVLPSEDRIRGEHIAKYAEMLASSNPDEFNRRFSKVLSRGLDPRELPKHFEEVKLKILEAYKEVVKT
ncbi:MAG: 50S ribosomal protein L18 [Thermoprotei archaeon]|nr:MAG: 50S ribosomal protein L18 [Thermoprotei archaeon]